MPRFRILPLLMALGVTFNHFHCLATDIEAAAYVVQQVQHALAHDSARDLGSIPQCENETGCICQGAIFIAPPACDLADLTVCQWVGKALPAVVGAAAPFENGASIAAPRRRNIAPLCAKGELRAWLGRFLI